MLYATRHGQTAWNAGDIISGVTDIPLSEEGLRQAQDLAEQAAQLIPVTLYCFINIPPFYFIYIYYNTESR